MPRRIEARAIIADIRSRLDKKALMEKYGLSSWELKTVLRQIAQERKARAQAITKDVMSDMSDSDLMEKHQLSVAGFQRVLDSLFAAGLISDEDFVRRDWRAHEVRLAMRVLPRFQPAMRIAVCYLSEPRERFSLADISVEGLAVQGMEARVGEVKRMAVLGDDLGITAPFEFEAECRWVTAGDSEELPVAGFHITSISDEDMVRLEDFIQTATEITETNLAL